MRKLILENKTGFNTALPFEIFDSKKILFYSSNFTNNISKGKQLNFNLPAGLYYYNGSFRKLSEPVKHKEIILPAKERNIEPKKYKIVFLTNPNKCTIFYGKGLIVFDTSFKTKPLYVRYSIYFHELGHHYYKTEKYADLYAVKKMFEYGFNPSQIGLVGLIALSDSSYDRQKFIIDNVS